MVMLVPSSSFGTWMKSSISMGEVMQGFMAGTSLQPGWADRGGPTMSSGCRFALADVTKPQSHSSDDS